MMQTTYSRPTCVEVDLKAICHNLNTVKEMVGQDVRVMVVVKANAYGHGMVEVSRVLQDCGVDYLGVATMDEAISLRQESITSPILILGSIFPEEVAAGLEHDITFTIYTKRLLKLLDQKGKKLKKVANFHLKIDTGMGRIGVWHEDMFDFLKTARGLKNTRLQGVYTHLAAADEDPAFTGQQISLFWNILDKMWQKGILPDYRHAANSMGIAGFKEAHLNLVRPGLLVYGAHPKKSLIDNLGLKPAFTLKTRIAHLKKTPPGRSISYGRTYVTQKHTRIATLPIGYGDGYRRAFSNKAQVLINGVRANVVGQVTMDQIMVDVGHISGVRIGDEAVLIGRQGAEEIKVEELAEMAGTIPYEIVCMINNRVPRRYL